MVRLINKYYKKSLELDKRFDEIKEKRWDYLTVLNELTVQVSHIFMISSDSKTIEKYRNINNLGDEVSDIFFQLILLIHYLDYDINKIEYNIEECDMKTFIIVLGQVSEALLEKAKLRFNKKRDGFQNLEEYIYFKISQLFSIVYNYAKNENINVDKEYELMLKDANNFLDNYKI